jgi:hypothetical protein
MAINLAQKFESKTSDLMKAKALSTAFTNQDWNWDGVNSINVYTLTDPTMTNYNPNGANRYGDPTEVEDTVQNFALTRDRSWTKTIDKKNSQDTMAVRKPGKYLAQATKNVLVPEIDTYVFAAINTAGMAYDRDDIVADAATTSSNAWTNFTAINADITDNEAPTEGRVCAMTAAYYNMLKQSGYVLASDSAYGDRKSGDLGTVDGVKVFIVPSSRMPANTDLIISHPSVCVAPEKLVDYTLHNNPAGISGDLLEYRHRYDAFVDVNRVKCIGLHHTA